MAKRGKGNSSILRQIAKVRLSIEAPTEADCYPVQLRLPGVRVDEAKVGTAKVEGKDSAYISVKLSE